MYGSPSSVLLQQNRGPRSECALTIGMCTCHHEIAALSERRFQHLPASSRSSHLSVGMFGNVAAAACDENAARATAGRAGGSCGMLPCLRVDPMLGIRLMHMEMGLSLVHSVRGTCWPSPQLLRDLLDDVLWCRAAQAIGVGSTVGTGVFSITSQVAAQQASGSCRVSNHPNAISVFPTVTWVPVQDTSQPSEGLQRRGLWEAGQQDCKKITVWRGWSCRPAVLVRWGRWLLAFREPRAK